MKCTFVAKTFDQVNGLFSDNEKNAFYSYWKYVRQTHITIYHSSFDHISNSQIDGLM